MSDNTNTDYRPGNEQFDADARMVWDFDYISQFRSVAELVSALHTTNKQARYWIHEAQTLPPLEIAEMYLDALRYEKRVCTFAYDETGNLYRVKVHRTNDRGAVWGFAGDIDTVHKIAAQHGVPAGLCFRVNQLREDEPPLDAAAE